MKKIMLLLVLLSTLVNINPTLELQTSKVLTNFQGEKLEQSNYMNGEKFVQFNYIHNELEYMLILKNELEFEIQQIDEDSFKVLL